MARTATVQLLDGDAAGCCECNILGWTGIAFRIPRKLLRDNHKDKDRKKLEKACDELKGGGIYFLFGKTERDGEWKKCVYVGQGDYYEDNRGEGTGVLRRVLQRHSGTIDADWEEVVVFVSFSKDKQPLNLNGLEKKFIERVSETLKTDKSYVFLNGNKPRPVVRPDSELDRFIDFANTALIVFGYHVLENGKTLPAPEPLPRQYKTPDDHGDSILNEGATLFRMKRRGCDAKGKWTGDKFIVLAGSKINPKPTDRCPKHILKIRKKFAKKIKGDKLVADIPFKSPSGASGFVRGASSNGKIEWRDKKGRTFADSLDIHPKPEPEPSHKDGIPLHMEYKGYKAKGTYVGKREFIIHKGSEICPTEIPSCSDTIKKMRKKHAHKIDENGVLTEDITFRSSSTAAELVCGSARNGYTSWHNKAKVPLGKLLKD